MITRYFLTWSFTLFRAVETHVILCKSTIIFLIEKELKEIIMSL